MYWPIGQVFCLKNLVFLWYLGDVDDVKKVLKKQCNKYKIIKLFTGFRFYYHVPQQQEQC